MWRSSNRGNSTFSSPSRMRRTRLLTSGFQMPALESRAPLGRTGAVGVEHPLVHDEIHDHLSVLAGGVDRMKDVARLDVQPHRCRITAAGDEPHTGRIAVVPAVREAPGAGRRHAVQDRTRQSDASDRGTQRERGEGTQRAGDVGGDGAANVERDRQVVDHHEVRGEREGVHHRAAPDPDRELAAETAVRSDDGVEDGVAPTEVVGDGVQLTGTRFLDRMGSVAAAHRAVEVAHVDRVKVVGEFGTGDARLDQGEGAPREADDVGVRRRPVQG